MASGKSWNIYALPSNLPREAPVGAPTAEACGTLRWCKIVHTACSPARAREPLTGTTRPQASGCNLQARPPLAVRLPGSEVSKADESQPLASRADLGKPRPPNFLYTGQRLTPDPQDWFTETQVKLQPMPGTWQVSSRMLTGAAAHIARPSCLPQSPPTLSSRAEMNLNGAPLEPPGHLPMSIR